MSTLRKRTQEEMNVLAADVARLSGLLTRERQSLPAAYLKDKGLRDAYLAYFLPSNLAKIHVPLAELLLHPAAMPDAGRLKVLDLGSGPGTSLFGLLEFFGAAEHKPVLDCIAVDQVAENLALAELLFAGYRERSAVTASLKTICGNVEHAAGLQGGPFHLIVLSNVLNELFAQDPDRTVKRLSYLRDVLKDLLIENGSCIIIEPALRETSRDLLEVRDGLAAEGTAVYGPCLRRGNCPALANPKDWCHEDIPWDPPELIRELDQKTGLRKDSLKFSWLVLRKDGKALSDIYPQNVFRVVSEPLVSKGKCEFYLCGRDGRKLATRPDKDRTARNEAFGALQRGDIAAFDGLLDEEKRYKVGKETGVAVLRKREDGDFSS